MIFHITYMCLFVYCICIRLYVYVYRFTDMFCLKRVCGWRRVTSSSSFNR